MCRLRVMSRRKTEALVRLAAVLMGDPYGRHYGYALMSEARILSGTLYPILDRMLTDGWVTAEWESPDEADASRPRRYYTLTNAGRSELDALLAEAATDKRFGFVAGAPS